VVLVMAFLVACTPQAESPEPKAEKRWERLSQKECRRLITGGGLRPSCHLWIGEGKPPPLRQLSRRWKCHILRSSPPSRVYRICPIRLEFIDEEGISPGDRTPSPQLAVREAVGRFS
jgi:hypothetical protein